MPLTLHDVLTRGRAAGQRLPDAEAGLLFAAATRIAAAQGSTLRSRLVSIDDAGGLQVSPFDDRGSEIEPNYLAPELVGAEAPRKGEPRSQVYAAGALGYELLTGRQAPDPHKGPGPELGGPLGDIVRMAMAHDRRERFGDLTQLLDAIEGVHPRPAPETEQQIISTVRTRAQRWAGGAQEREAVSKLNTQVQSLEAMLQRLQSQLAAATQGQADTLERLDRLESGLARAEEDRRHRPGSILPGAIAGTVAAVALGAGAWASGMLGAAARPRFGWTGAAEPRAAAEPLPPPAVAEPADSPDATVAATGSEADAGPPDTRAAVPDAAVAAALPPADAGPSRAAAAADDAGVVAAVAPAAGAGVAPVPSPAAPPPAAAAPKERVTSQMLVHVVAQSQVQRGQKALEARRLDEAITSFKAAIDNEPRLAVAWRGLGLSLALQGNRAQAQRAWRRYSQLQPDAPDAGSLDKGLAQLRANR